MFDILHKTSLICYVKEDFFLTSEYLRPNVGIKIELTKNGVCIKVAFNLFNQQMEPVKNWKMFWKIQ